MCPCPRVRGESRPKPPPKRHSTYPCARAPLWGAARPVHFMIYSSPVTPCASHCSPPNPKKALESFFWIQSAEYWTTSSLLYGNHSLFEGQYGAYPRAPPTSFGVDERVVHPDVGLVGVSRFDSMSFTWVKNSSVRVDALDVARCSRRTTPSWGGCWRGTSERGR